MPTQQLFTETRDSHINSEENIAVLLWNWAHFILSLYVKLNIWECYHIYIETCSKLGGTFRNTWLLRAVCMEKNYNPMEWQVMLRGISPPTPVLMFMIRSSKRCYKTPSVFLHRSDQFNFARMHITLQTVTAFEPYLP